MMRFTYKNPNTYRILRHADELIPGCIYLLVEPVIIYGTRIIAIRRSNYYQQNEIRVYADNNYNWTDPYMGFFTPTDRVFKYNPVPISALN